MILYLAVPLNMILSALAGLSVTYEPARVEPGPPGADRSAIEFFETKIRPLFLENCSPCHGAKRQRGGLRLDSAEAILRGGDRGAAVVPGDSGKSLLIQAIRYADQDLQMPPKGKLSDPQIADLTRWIK